MQQWSGERSKTGQIACTTRTFTISLTPSLLFPSFLSCQDQAFGQPFFEELKSDEANVITILMWPVMNLMLVNLLIAIMNDRCV